jgi:hypothetical protein
MKCRQNTSSLRVTYLNKYTSHFLIVVDLVRHTWPVEFHKGSSVLLSDIFGSARPGLCSPGCRPLAGWEWLVGQFGLRHGADYSKLHVPRPYRHCDQSLYLRFRVEILNDPPILAAP